MIQEFLFSYNVKEMFIYYLNVYECLDCMRVYNVHEW